MYNHVSYLLYPPMYADFVPLVIIKSDLIGLDLCLLFAIGEAHRQAQSAIFDGDVQVIGAITCNMKIV